MAEMLNNLDAPSDAELITRVRGGDVEAYGQLFERHVNSARRLARQLVRGPDSEDLVSDAFTKVMGALQGGGGPDIAFRAYLLTSVRRLHVDRIRSQARLTPSDDLSQFEAGVPFQDTMVEQFDNGAAARAFARLPERWQMVLWHLEVERQKPADIAPLLGMTANSVSALAYRAREGLRQAFLSAHLAEIDDADCSWTVEHLGAYVRKGLSKRDSGKVQSHLDGCRSCSGMYLELVEVNGDLSGVLAPLLLGGLAAGYLTGTGAGVTAGGVIALLDRAKDYVLAHVVPVSAGSTAAGVAAAVVISGGMGVGGGRLSEPEAGALPSTARTGGPEDAGTTAGVSERTGPSGTLSKTEGKQQGPATPSDQSTPGPDAGAAPSGTPGTGQPTDVLPTPRSIAGTATLAPPPGGGSTSPGATQKPSPTDTGPPARDMALTLDGTMLTKGIGRLRARVSNLPVASGPTPLDFIITFTDDVTIHAVPDDCTLTEDGASCTGTSGRTWNGIFDVDMNGADPGTPVEITMAVSSDALKDPYDENNRQARTMTRVGAS
jgi:RNA polymerase sigma factor (sigma-70 family)